MKLSVTLIENNNEYIANCPELDINCYGSNRKEAMNRIKKVIYFYIDSTRELGIDIDNIEILTDFSINGEEVEKTNILQNNNLFIN